MNIHTYDNLIYRLKKGTTLILLTDYIKPEFLTKKGKLLKAIKDSHIQSIYDAFEAFGLVYGESIKEHNEWVLSKSDCIIFSTIKAH